MTKLTTKIANILLTLLILSAICIAPIAASPAKLTTDSSVKEVAIDNFYTKVTGFTPNEKWSDRTLYKILEFCALDEKCWTSLSPHMKEKYEKLSKNKLVNIKLDKKLGLISSVNKPHPVIDIYRAKYANKGWLDKDVYSSGTLKLSYKNNPNNDNKFTIKATFTPKTIETYNHTFRIDPTDQKEAILIDKTFNLNTELSNNDRDYIDIIIKIIDKQASINDVALLIEGTVFVISVGTTIASCIGIPATLGVSSLPCIASIVTISTSGGFLASDAINNAEIKKLVANHINELDLDKIQFNEDL